GGGRGGRRGRRGAGVPRRPRGDGRDGTAGLSAFAVPAGCGRRVPRRGVRRVVPRPLVPDRPEAHAATDRPRHPGAARCERRRDRRDREEWVWRYTVLRTSQPVTHGGCPTPLDRDPSDGGPD